MTDRLIQSFSLGVTVFIVFFLLQFAFLLAITVAYRKRKRNHERLQSQFSQTLLQSQLEIKEQTLTHISRELHDNLGQVASLIKINLNTFPVHDTAKAEQKLEDTRELIRQLLTDLKTLSFNLNGDRIQSLGLAAALSQEVERLNKTGLFKAEYIGPAQLNLQLEPNRLIILFRMAQEVLNNIVKHSGASFITVNLHTTENIIILAMSDNGKGFDVEKSEIAEGTGLINLQNRATLINATLTMKSAPGNGSNITIELPV